MKLLTNAKSNICFHCHKGTLKILETRNATASSRRRRYECQVCSKRSSTYEISESFFDEAIENRRLLAGIRKIVFSNNKLKEQNFACCDTCQFNEGSYCDKDIPEYNTSESYDCNYFQRIQSKLTLFSTRHDVPDSTASLLQ